jgi:hypothetical protein
MECIFRGLKTNVCLSGQKCIGIEQLVSDLGGSELYAKGFGKYAYRVSLLNKIQDLVYETKQKSQESKNRGLNHFKLNFLSTLSKSVSVFIGDPYQIREPYLKIEQRVFLKELEPVPQNPMEYFAIVGEGYGFFFYYATLGSTKSLALAKLAREYGTTIGTLVALRDAVIDYYRDIKFGKYNPLKHLSPKKVMAYYSKQVVIIKTQTQAIYKQICNDPNYKSHIQTTKKINSFGALSNYVMHAQTFCARCSSNMLINQNQSSISKVMSGILGAILCGTIIHTPCPNAAAMSAVPQSLLQESSSCGCCCCSCVENCVQACTTSLESACNCDCGCNEACSNCCQDNCNTCCAENCDCNNCCQNSCDNCCEQTCTTEKCCSNCNCNC